MKTTIKSTTIGKPNEFTKEWCSYTLHDAYTLETVHVGHIRLSQLLTISDARNNPLVDFDRLYVVDVFDVSDNEGLAMRATAAKRCELGLVTLPKPRSTVIECVTTGERFRSAIDAVKTHGITQSALSNHLNNKPGFNSVKGKVYKKIV